MSGQYLDLYLVGVAGLLFCGLYLLLWAVKTWADTSAFIGPFAETGEWIPYAYAGGCVVVVALALGALIIELKAMP